MNAEGKDVISLAIGSPDMPPSKQTIDKLCEVATQATEHGYQPTIGTTELRSAMAGFINDGMTLTLMRQQRFSRLLVLRKESYM